MNYKDLDYNPYSLISLKTKPKIRNVVCTANLEQKVEIVKLSGLTYGIYDKAIYLGRCGYIKTPQMDGRVSVYPSGKMISVGGKSISRAKKQLEHAKFFLIRENMIQDITLTPKIQNIVATLDIKQKIPIDDISSKIAGAIYDPETFPGLILKGLHSCSFLIFASGKIVITGAKSIEETTRSLFELLQKLNNFLD